MPTCSRCGTQFRVPADESPGEHGCPRCPMIRDRPCEYCGDIHCQGECEEEPEKISEEEAITDWWEGV